VSWLKYKLRTAYYNVSSKKVNEGQGKCNENKLKYSTLKVPYLRAVVGNPERNGKFEIHGCRKGNNISMYPNEIEL
jgi:hypothetical protein